MFTRMTPKVQRLFMAVGGRDEFSTSIIARIFHVLWYSRRAVQVVTVFLEWAWLLRYGYYNCVLLLCRRLAVCAVNIGCQIPT